MERAFNLLDEFPYVVVTEPGAQAEGPRFDFERRNRGSFGAGAQAEAEAVVHDLLDGLAGASRFGPELGRHIVLKSQGCSHILMLSLEHHEVNAEKGRGRISVRWFYKLPLRFRPLFRKRRVEQELSEKLCFHLEKLIQ